ncbi:MAG: Crp/Fnr family transcriptional regulator [Methylococcus sp.]
MLLYNLFRHSKDYIEIKAGEALMREGESGEDMYVLIEGQALIEYRGTCFAEIGPGDFAGELAVIDRAPRMASVIAKTDCRFVPITRKRFEFLIAETPRFSLEIMRVLAQRLRRTDELYAGREENSPSAGECKN